VPVIRLETIINAPIELCFDLSRSVDVHMASMSATGERAVDGVTSGLLELADEVTWEATHLGIRQQLTSRITELTRPHRFVDEMQRGAFKRLHHVHEFQTRHKGTLMRDEMNFNSPLGWLGGLVDTVYIRRYMRRLLIIHNDYVKAVAEQKSMESGV
jgi:ligand-binding SRPBCC domain-containing protein